MFQTATYPPNNGRLHVGVPGHSLTTRLIRWNDDSLSLVLDVGPGYIQVQITSQQAQQLAQQLTAADRAVRVGD